MYNSLANSNREGGWATLHPPSDVYVRSFLSRFHTLIKLCYTHTHTKRVDTCITDSVPWNYCNIVTQLSDQISRSVVSDSLRPHESQHARPPRPSPTPGVHSDSHYTPIKKIFFLSFCELLASPGSKTASGLYFWKVICGNKCDPG